MVVGLTFVGSYLNVLWIGARPAFWKFIVSTCCRSFSSLVIFMLVIARKKWHFFRMSFISIKNYSILAKPRRNNYFLNYLIHPSTSVECKPDIAALSLCAYHCKNNKQLNKIGTAASSIKKKSLTTKFPTNCLNYCQ